MRLSRGCFCFPLNGSGLLGIAIATTIVYGGVFIWLLVRRISILDYFQSVSNVASPFLYLCMTVSGLACLCSIFGIFSTVQLRGKMVHIYGVLYWFVVAMVAIVTFASWIAFFVEKDDAVASCRLSTNTASGFYGDGPLDMYRGSCEDSVRHLLIVGGFIVFVGNAVQIYLAMVITASALWLKNNMQQQQQQQQQQHYPLQHQQHMPPPPIYYNNDNTNNNPSSYKGPYY